jgi:glycerol-3-phosphate dehydrogenase
MKREDETSEAAVIGLGAMGSALAWALLHDWRRVTIWNRTSAAESTFQRSDPLLRSLAGNLRKEPVLGLK